MSKRHTEQAEVVDRYLLGHLSEREEEEFEKCYLDDPDIVADLKLGKSIVDSFQTAEEMNMLDDLRADEGNISPNRAAKSWISSFGMAASVVLVGSLAYNAVLYRAVVAERSVTDKLETQIAQAFSPQINTKVLILGGTRSTAGAPTFVLPISDEPEWFVLRLELDRNLTHFKDYRALLLDEEGAVVWQGSDLSPDYEDSLTVSLHSTQLSPRNYQIVIDGVEATGESVAVARYTFEVKDKQ